MNPFEVALVFLAMFLFVIGIAYVGGNFLTKRETKNYAKLQARYPNSVLTVTDSPVLKGHIKGMPFVCFTGTSGYGRGKSYWVEFDISNNLNVDYFLFLKLEHVFLKMGKAIDLKMAQELQVGVPDLDNKYFIKSNDESLTKTLLLHPSIQRKLMENPNILFGELIINKKHIIYRLGDGFDNDNRYEHFAAVLDIIEEMMDVLKSK